MLLLLLCFLMKLVDLSMLNRSRNGSANNPNHQHNHFYQNHNHHTHNHNHHQLNHNNYNSNNQYNNYHYNHYNKNMHYYDGSGNVGPQQVQHQSQQQQQQQQHLLSGHRDIYSGFGRRPLSSTGSDSSHSSYSSSDSAKENRISNYNINNNSNSNNNLNNNSNNNDNELNKTIIQQQQRMLLLLHQQKQQLIEEQLKKLSSQQYQQLLLQQQQQQQKFADQQKQQQSKQHNLLSKHQLYNIKINSNNNDNSNSNNNFDINKSCSIKNNTNNKKTWAEIGSKKCLGLNSDINIQGIKSHRGMTEHPNTESSSPLHKSSSLSSSPRRPPPPSVFSSNINNQISCNNNTTIITSPKRLHPTTLLSPTKTRQNNRNFQQNYIQNSNINNQEILYKRPLTSPNATIFNLNNYYNNGMPYNYNTFNAYNKIQCSVGSLNDINDCNSSINGSNTSQDNLQRSIENELTEEHLKQNVAIVLNNLDRRYQNTLRSIILNEQINNLALSYNNNDIFTTSGQNNSNDITMMAANLLSSPVSGQDDYNSNPASIGQHLTTFATAYGSPNTPGFTFTNGHLNCSIASSHDFTHDNSDYQWFLDYGYRDGVAHQSVLSSLSASYNGIGELSYYEDLAKDIDANLAEVDMESFRTEDIHSLLTHIPSFCSKKHTPSEIDNSICKSELLFSPVKESHISTDSLDLDAYQDDADIILTCKANKDNYTIAFEGSTLYSDESFYAEPNELNIRNRQNFINLHSNLDDIVKRKSLEVSMCRSDNAFTTWSKLKKNSALQLQRYPSGNNNTSINVITRHAPHCFVRKSSSLPNLRIRKEIQRQLNVSQAISTSTVDSTKLRNLLPMCQIPVSAISVDDCSTDQTNETGDGSSNVMHTTDESSIGNGTDCGSNGGSGVIKNQQQNQPAFNLVKLFIKQKSSSSDTCMDVSSGCWPSSDASSSSEQQQNNQRCRKKIMHDSDKSCSSGATTKDAIKEDDNLLDTELKIVEHTDDDDDNEMTLNHNNCNTTLGQVNEDSSYQLDSLDICEESNCSNKDSLNTTPTKKTKSTELYRDGYESSPTHKLRMQQQQHLQQQIMRNPQLLNLALQNNNNLNKINNNNSLSSEASRTSDNLTQIYCNNNADRIKIPTEVVTRSIQTSFLLKDRVRFVPPSFLAKLNKLGDEKPAPVYVIYPNYALPDLGFVKNNLADIVLSPFNYKAALAAATGNHRNLKIRPKSLTSSQEEVLKNIDYKNITDWKSLVTLLPIEYRKRLKHIPEADVELDPECSMKPLFCMSPPIRRNNIKANLCDCAMFFQQQQLQQACDSSSGSSHQPSSGYRGSSTLLTDSDFDPPTLTSNSPGSAPALNNIDPIKNMFVYQYENNRIDSEILQEKLPPSGRTPKGILRRNLKSGSQARLKRNSMFEEENSNVRNLEKRRSLQEPPYDEHHIIEDYLAEAPEDEKELQYYDDMQQNLLSNRNDINCILDNYSKTRNSLERKSRRDYDLDARIRAENFLSNVPKSDLKYYAEIASILESAENNSTTIQYDAVKLKNEVSRALCQQKRVSFIQNGNIESGGPTNTTYLQTNISGKKFTTPPNSPNISMAGLRVNNSNNNNNNRLEKENIKEMTQAEKERQNKISSNRFKRLQIQWELLSKDSSMMLKDLASEKETKSGGSTPTSASGGLRSRIPRPVSYPASKRKIIQNKSNPENRPTQEVTKAFRSPSRIVPPKKYTAPPNTSPINAPHTHTTALTMVNNIVGQNTTSNRTRTPNSRISNNGNLTTTPKQRVQSPRATPRTR